MWKVGEFACARRRFYIYAASMGKRESSDTRKNFGESAGLQRKVVSVIPSAKLSASDLLTIAHSSVDQAKQEECDRAFVPILGRDASSTSHPMGDGLGPAKGDCTGASALKGDRVVILSL